MAELERVLFDLPDVEARDEGHGKAGHPGG